MWYRRSLAVSTSASMTSPTDGWRCAGRGQVLSYRVFGKDQRVSHTAVVENKRLGHALRIIKAKQDVQFIPKIKTNSEKIGYRKRERKTEAVEMTA